MRSRFNKEYAFIFELKYLKWKKGMERLKESSQVALRQMEKNDYINNALRFGYEKVYCSGVAFSGKNYQISIRNILK